jgi:hypothetical protein
MNKEYEYKTCLRLYHNERDDLYGEITSIFGYSPDEKIGDKVLLHTKEELDDAHRLLDKAVKDHKNGTGVFAKKINLETKKEVLNHNNKTINLNRYFDDEYLDEIINLAVKNKFIKLVPIEKDLLPFEEFENGDLNYNPELLGAKE